MTSTPSHTTDLQTTTMAVPTNTQSPPMLSSSAVGPQDRTSTSTLHARPKNRIFLQLGQHVLFYIDLFAGLSNTTRRKHIEHTTAVVHSLEDMVQDINKLHLAIPIDEEDKKNFLRRLRQVKQLIKDVSAGKDGQGNPRKRWDASEVAAQANSTLRTIQAEIEAMSGTAMADLERRFKEIQENLNVIKRAEDQEHLASGSNATGPTDNVPPLKEDQEQLVASGSNAAGPTDNVPPLNVAQQAAAADAAQSFTSQEGASRPSDETTSYESADSAVQSLTIPGSANTYYDSGTHGGEGSGICFRF